MLHLLALAHLNEQLIHRLAAGDDVLLQRALCCCAILGHQENRLLQKMLENGCRIYVLREMLMLYGVDHVPILPGVEIIGYSDFVDLTVKNPLIQTWL
jgi:sulfur relay protein TusB/DsrH